MDSKTERYVLCMQATNMGLKQLKERESSSVDTEKAEERLLENRLLVIRDLCLQFIS